MPIQRILLALIVILALGLLAGCPSTPPPDDVAEVPAGKCEAPDGWFPAGGITPPPDPNTALTDNCSFHQWAWQSFLSMVEGHPPLFETWDPPLQFYCAEGTSPLDKCQESHDSDKKCTHVLAVRAVKQDNTLSPGEATPIGAPSSEQLVMYDRGAYANGAYSDANPQPVFSTSRINPVWEETIESYSTYDLRTPDGLKAFTEDPSANLGFRIGTIEIKAAWVPASDLKNGDSAFFTTCAYETPSGGSGACELIDVSLVGLHVVGWVAGQKEAVWATFEHVDNAPDCAATDQTYPDDRWNFYKPGTDCTQIPNDCNVPQKISSSAHPTQVCRPHPYGNGGEENETNIADLNASVHSKLPPDSVWRNYHLIGTLWTTDGQLPKPDGSNFTGSTLLADTTLETFVGPTSEGAQGQNCFSCHNSNNPFPDPAKGFDQVQKDVFLSHLVALPEVLAEAGAQAPCTPLGGTSASD